MHAVWNPFLMYEHTHIYIYMYILICLFTPFPMEIHVKWICMCLTGSFSCGHIGSVSLCLFICFGWLAYSYFAELVLLLISQAHTSARTQLWCHCTHAHILHDCDLPMKKKTKIRKFKGVPGSVCLTPPRRSAFQVLKLLYGHIGRRDGAMREVEMVNKWKRFLIQGPLPCRILLLFLPSPPLPTFLFLSPTQPLISGFLSRQDYRIFFFLPRCPHWIAIANLQLRTLFILS